MATDDIKKIKKSNVQIDTANNLDATQSDILDLASPMIFGMSSEYINSLSVDQYVEIPLDLPSLFEWSGLRWNRNLLRAFKEQTNHNFDSNPAVYEYVTEDGNIKRVYAVNAIEWDEKHDRLIVTMNGEYLKFARNREKGLTEIPLIKIKMRGKYSKQIYDALCQKKNKKITFKGEGTLKGQIYSLIFTKDGFSDYLNLAKSYREKMSNLRKIADSIAEEITELTDINCRVEYNKQKTAGKRNAELTHVCFFSTPKSADNEIVLTEDDFAAGLKAMIFGSLGKTDEERECSYRTIAKAIGKTSLSQSEIMQMCKNVISNRNVANKGGAIVYNLQNNIKPKPADSKFNDIEQRQYDFSALEKKLFNKNSTGKYDIPADEEYPFRNQGNEDPEERRAGNAE